jgi:hypothetical protein
MSSAGVQRVVSAERAEPCAESSIRPVAMAGLVLCIAAFWMAQHPYERIVHDSILYAFSALARLYPSSLGRDIYLTVGIQDRFTIFSPLVAPLIRIIGLRQAATLITFSAQLAFFFVGWLLARRLMPTAHAILALALLVSLPTTYGDRHIFSYAEAFMTPRLPCEVLVLGTLIAVLSRRYVLAALCLAAAFAVHPIMATAGLAMLFFLEVGSRKPWLAVAIAAAGLIVVVAAAWLFPFGPVSTFDAGWFALLYSGGSYLFPSRWGLVDWAHASIPLSVLAVGWLTVVDREIRAICAAALVAGLTGLAISLVGADLLHVVLIAQVQPWRWLWLSNALAVIVLPAVFRSCWQCEDATRTVVVLLAAGWVCIDNTYAPIIGACAILIASIGKHINDPRRVRFLFAASCLVLLFCVLGLAQFVVGVIKDVQLLAPDRTLYDSPYLLELRQFKPWQAGGIVPVTIFLAAWWTATHRKDMPTAVAIVVCGAALCGAFAQFSWNTWNRWPRAQLSKPLISEFAPWRRVIPQSAKVLWADSAFPTWFLLHRPSYWSREQMAAAVFSEPLSWTLTRRKLVIDTIAKSTHDPHLILTRTCQSNPALGYIIFGRDAGPTPYPSLKNPRGAGILRLYNCSAFRT